jgi:hypothetical protein
MPLRSSLLLRLALPILASLLAVPSARAACTGPAAVCPQPGPTAFPLIAHGRPASLLFESRKAP